MIRKHSDSVLTALALLMAISLLAEPATARSMPVCETTWVVVAKGDCPIESKRDEFCANHLPRGCSASSTSCEESDPGFMMVCNVSP